VGRWTEQLKQQRETVHVVREEDSSHLPSSPASSTLSSTERTTNYELRSADLDPIRAWYHRNREAFTTDGGRRRFDPGGFCMFHGRPLAYPEQQLGACNWCLSPADSPPPIRGRGGAPG
jgi:hypothetical protein